jgi:lipoprotein-anchoring transpeptidase ErfK/SrfK
MITSLFLATFVPAIVIDLKNFRWVAFDGNDPANAEVVRTGAASGGRRWCPDIKRKCKTPLGMWKVLSKRGPHYRSPLYPIGCGVGKAVKCAPMPHYVKFRHSGEGIHGSNADWKNPKHESHGCVRVRTEDAQWINENTNRDTTIIVLPY